MPGKFVGADNFVKIWSDDIFRAAVWNTCLLQTFVTTVFKLALGLWLALLLNRHFRGKAFMRAFILLALHHSHRAIDLWLEVDVKLTRTSGASSTGCCFPHGHHRDKDQLAGRLQPWR